MLITDAPAARCGSRPLREEEHRRHIEREGLLELLLADGFERHQESDAGIVDEDIERPAGFFHMLDDGVDAGGCGKIGRQRLDSAAELLAGGVELLGVAADDQDVRTLAQKRLGDRQADTVRPTGDQRALVVKSHGMLRDFCVVESAVHWRPQGQAVGLSHGYELRPLPRRPGRGRFKRRRTQAPAGPAGPRHNS